MFPDTSPLLTDMYQLTMAYAHWKHNRHQTTATFDLYFRSSPFNLTFTVFAGLRRALNFLSSYNITQADGEYFLSLLPNSDPKFLQYLQSLSSKDLRVQAQREGSLCSPHTPLLSISGPLAFLHLLETPLLNLINFPSLIATNAHRFRAAIGSKASLSEFGLRRAQGPDGALSASIYSFLGGFNSTSNIAASRVANIPPVGTVAHAFVQSFHSLAQISETSFSTKLKTRASKLSVKLDLHKQTREGELAAFISYAAVFPDKFLALVDTYDVFASGIPNFMCVALALMEMGYQPIGVRLDSGNLVDQSVKVSQQFRLIGQRYCKVLQENLENTAHMVSKLQIMASNDITVDFLLSLNNQKHCINGFGVGTHLVTCREQPALGCVYKLVSVDGRPSTKFSEDQSKKSLPGEKTVYRFYGRDNVAVADLISLKTEQKPLPGGQITCFLRHNLGQKVVLQIHRVEELLSTVFHNGSRLDGSSDSKSLMTARSLLINDTTTCLPDVTVSKVAVRDDFFVYISEGLTELIIHQQMSMMQKSFSEREDGFNHKIAQHEMMRNSGHIGNGTPQYL